MAQQYTCQRNIVYADKTENYGGGKRLLDASRTRDVLHRTKSTSAVYFSVVTVLCSSEPKVSAGSRRPLQQRTRTRTTRLPDSKTSSVFANIQGMPAVQSKCLTGTTCRTRMINKSLWRMFGIFLFPWGNWDL